MAGKDCAKIREQRPNRENTFVFKLKRLRMLSDLSQDDHNQGNVRAYNAKQVALAKTHPTPFY